MIDKTAQDEFFTLMQNSKYPCAMGVEAAAIRLRIFLALHNVRYTVYNACVATFCKFHQASNPDEKNNYFDEFLSFTEKNKILGHLISEWYKQEEQLV